MIVRTSRKGIEEYTMANDRVTKVSRQNIFSRLGGAIKGVVIGLLIFLVSFPVLFLNEGRAVKTAKSLKEGAAAVVSVDASRVDPGRQGALIHVSGEAKTAEILRDKDFPIEVNAIALERKVEMYQWREDSSSQTREKIGGTQETVTTYTYSKDWSSSVIDSSRFQEKQGHQNPGKFPYEALRVRAEKVELGAFTLGTSIASQLDRFTPYAVDDAFLKALPDNLRERASIVEGKLFIGANPASPQIGDVRIAFGTVPPATVSVIGAQQGSVIDGYTTSNGRTLAMVKTGLHSADAMFEAAQQENATLTWILRLVGFVMMFLGLAMILGPLSVMASVIPFVGRIVGAGTRLIAGFVAAGLSLVTIAIGWIVYRPLLGLLLLLVAGGLIAAAFVLIKKSRGAPGQASSGLA
jgi:hypothetical protein